MSGDRNYIAEMRDRISEATEGGGWVARVVAAKLHAELLETDPELVEGWLNAIAVHVLAQVIRDQCRSQRSSARQRAGSRAFSEAADEAERTGDSSLLIGMFAVPHVVDEGFTQKRAADMTGPEHLFVAEHTYEQSANEALMYAAFHRAVARKVGKKRTADVMSETQYEALYRSITRSPAKAVA